MEKIKAWGDNADLSDGRRRRWLGQALGLLSLSGCASRDHHVPQAETGPTGDPPIMDVVTPFSAVGSGQWPLGWHPYVLRRDLPRTRYDVVRDDGRMVMRARAARSATGLHCAVKPAAAGRLRFSWKVPRVAPDASLDTAELDDSPARVVVAFDGDHSRLSLRDRLLFDQVELFTGHRLPYAMLMYVWGGQDNAINSVHRNHRTARIQYLTVERGAERAGRWLQYERDLALDHLRAFGEAPGPVISIGVLTDADAMKLELEALYGDITLLPSAAG